MASSGANTTTRSTVETIWTVSASDTVKLEHYVQTTRSSDGAGLAASSGGTEVYATLIIERIS